MDKLVNMQKMRGTESKEDLLKSTEEQAGVGYGSPLTDGSNNLLPPSDVALGQIEKKFLLHAERGDCATVRRLLSEYKDQPNILNINCVDPLDRSALISAIENENIELITLLLQEGIQVKDALLHTIKEEYVEAVEILLQWEEEHHIAGQPYSWEAVDRSSSTFTPDITPLILAAHRNNYEILKILLDRGASLPMPHDVRCGCDECVVSSDQDSLRHSQSRINAYRALSASSLIALSSRDPLLTAFELSWELRRLSRMETEFRADYNEMRMQCQEFATSLLDHARTSFELEVMLNYNPYGENWEPGERQTLDRLKLAIKYKQKMFVAHPNVQQLLAAIWYEGLPGFRRKGMLGQIVQVAKLGTMFPIYSAIYMIAPKSKMGLFMKKPFVKFICHSSSYAFFLMLLGLASQRAEYLVLEWIGTPWMRSILADWKRRERGALPGFIEFSVIIYVISLIWNEMRALWNRGLMEYVADLWNIVDFITNVFYMMWISLRFASWFVVQRDSWSGLDPWYPREEWDTYDPMLLSEGAFAAGMIFSFLKLVHIFSINPHLGPLQVSLGRMIIDIIKFFFIYTLVLFAFGCGMNQLMWYYADLEKNKCYHLPNGLPDFDNNEKSCAIWRRYANLFETSQSLFWASFGMVDLLTFELQGIKSFTRFWALLMFGSYSVINVIVLLNMLIAMMSNSYQIISERSDTEWKFARSHLWMSYFDEGDTVPPPFNLIPTTKTFTKTMGCGKSSRSSTSIKKKSKEKAQKRHDTVMRLLVRRFVTAEQRKRDDFGITEDDVLEIRQDISTLRYELIDILKTNGMKTPNIDRSDPLGGKKGRVMERRLLKDFQIGIVEGIVNEVITNEKQPKDVFSQIAKAIGKRTSSSSKNKDWNALVRQNTGARDPIGSTTEALMRQSRQSLRRHIVDNANAGISLDTNKLIEYNPLLSEMPPTARVAYAKFMKTKIKQEMDTRDADDVTQSEAEKASALDQNVVKAGTEDEKPASGKQGEITLSVAQLSIIRERPRSKIPSGDGLTSSVKFKDSRDTDASEIEMDSRKLTVEKTHFRSRTPILEDPEEDQEITSDIPEIVTSADIEVEPKSDVQADTQKKEEKASSEVEGLKPKTQLSLPSTSEPPTSTPPRQPTTGVTKEKGRSKVSGKEVTGWI